ncbi:MAG: hypothetical protein KBB94_09430 [Legionellaceae bacterium]|nr:hypothetical protein [Legionellaceae bacterium]MBP9775672.1 hypothetical protein [Legionellaceae bacterium]
MLCKYEGGEYIPYDMVVSNGKLADVVDIKFEELETQDCLAALQKAQWAKMPALKKMVIHDCTVPQYEFPRQGVLKNLEEIAVSESLLDIITTQSLLTAAPNITKFSRDHSTSFPIVTKLTEAEHLRDEVELKIQEINSRAKSAAVSLFDIAAQRRSIPVQAMKDGDPNSGETFVPQYVQDEDAVQSHSDGDSIFDFDRDYISQTGTSDSDSERMEGQAVPSSSIGASSTLRNEEEARRLNRWLSSRKVTEEVDDASSLFSFEVSRVDERKTQQHDDNASVSTFSGSEFPRQSPPPIPSHQVEVTPWGREDALSDAGLRNMSADSLLERDDELQSAAEVVSIEVTYYRSQPQLSTSGTSIPISHSLTIEEFNDLTVDEQNSIETMTITGQGPGGPDVGSSLDWSNLSGLRELRLTGVTVEKSLAQATFFDSLESIRFQKCGVDPDAFYSFYLSSGTDLKVMELDTVYGLGLNDYAWRPLNQTEISSIQRTIAILYSDNSRNSDVDPSISPRSFQPDDFEFTLGKPTDANQRKRSAAEDRLSPQVSTRSQTSEIICFLNNSTRGKSYFELSEQEFGQVSSIYYLGTGPDDNAMTVAWEKLTGLRSVNISNASVLEDEDLSGDVKLSKLQEINFTNCSIGLSAIKVFVNESSPQLRQFNMVECLANEEEIPFIQELKQKVSSRRPMSLNAVYLDDDDDLDDDIPLPSRDSGHTIECFIEGRGWVDYTGLSSAQKQTVTGIRLTGKRLDADATNAVGWSQFPNLTYLEIANSTVTKIESRGDEGILFPNMEKIVMYGCCVSSGAVVSFGSVSGESLTEFTVRDPLNSHGVPITGREQADFESMVAEVNAIQVQFPPPPPPPSLTEDEDPEFFEAMDLAESYSADSSNPRGDHQEEEEEEDMENSFSLPRSPQLSTRSQTAEIICYFDNSDEKLYSDLTAEEVGRVRGINYHGTGPEDNAMATVDWEKLTGLRRMNIFDASVSDATSFRVQNGKTLFPELSKMCFYGCKLGPKAIEGFVKHASSKLQTFETLNCDSELGQSARKIAELKVAVNQRGKASMPSHGAPNRRSATGRANSWHDDLWMESPGSNRSESSTPRNSSRTTIRSEDGAHNRTQPASRGPMSTGAAAGAATNRPSLFTPPPAQHRTTSAGNLGSVHTAGATAGSVQNRYKSFSREPELVVDNESENSRNYKKLVDDTAAALGLIKQETSFDGNNYRFSTNEDEQTTSITYQQRDRMVTPILDAGIDTVKVHRGWGQVDRTISHETRAQIVLASLGIPPCPPDIAISNERSGLGRAIRAEFNKLKLRPDEPEITVTIKSR